MNGHGLLVAAAVVALCLVVRAALRSRSRELTIRRADTSTPGVGHSTTRNALVCSIVCICSGVAVIFPRMLLLVVPLLVIGWYGAKTWRRRTTMTRYERDLPIALDAVARSMRSGAGLAQAIEECSRLSDNLVCNDFSEISRQVRHGCSMLEALDRWQRGNTSSGVETATASLSLALRTGAAHAEVIDRVAMSVRQVASAKAMARVQAAQARSSMWALVLLPVVFTVPMTIIDPAVRGFLFESWIGLAVLVAGVGLDAVGALWMSRLIARATA